jgi:hypothetical protein
MNAYETWMVDYLLIEAMNAACFKVADGSAMATCGKAAPVTGAERGALTGDAAGYRFNPLMQTWITTGTTLSTKTQND